MSRRGVAVTSIIGGRSREWVILEHELAAAGSVVLGGTNLTPEPAFSAEMISAKGGEVDITHP